MAVKAFNGMDRRRQDGTGLAGWAGKGRDRRGRARPGSAGEESYGEMIKGMAGLDRMCWARIGWAGKGGGRLESIGSERRDATWQCWIGN